MASWYYVRGNERVGPVSYEDLEDLVGQGELDEQSYVWTKGFDNWRRMGVVDDLIDIFTESIEENFQESFESGEEQDSLDDYELGEIDWEAIDELERVFSVKIGIDRGCKEAEYGPYNFKELKRAFGEKRINDKTLIFVPGMENWEFLGDLPIFEQITPLPPRIKDEDRRRFIRKPFVARILFHDEQEVYEGVCRDVSIGGAQVLIPHFPGDVGDIVTMNVHPDNSSYGFVAKGKVVRILDGNHGFSLRFVDLSPEASRAIQNYVDEN